MASRSGGLSKNRAYPILTSLFLLHGLANAGSSEIGTTLYSSSGNYGLEPETDFSYVAVHYKYKNKRWSIKTDIPYLKIAGPGNVIEGVDAPQPLDRKDKGLGDITLQARYLAHVFSDNRTVVSYSGKIKTPTADEKKDLGSGITDYTLQTDLSHRIKNATPFISLGYVWRGNSPERKYENTVKTTAGLDYRLNMDYAFGYLYQYRESSIKTSDDIKNSTLYGNIRFTPGMSLMAFITMGHSDSTADRGFGTTLVFKF